MPEATPNAKTSANVFVKRNSPVPWTRLSDRSKSEKKYLQKLQIGKTIVVIGRSLTGRDRPCVCAQKRWIYRRQRETEEDILPEIRDILVQSRVTRLIVVVVYLQLELQSQQDEADDDEQRGA